MSNELDPIVAGIGFNDGANKGFWRKQPRDFKKRWVEMGAEVRAMFKKQREDGTTEQVSKTGKVVGSTGTEDQARVLFEPDADFPDGTIAAVNSDNLESIKAELSDEYLKSQGIDPNSDKFGNPVSGLVAQDLSDLELAPITQGDRDLAAGGTDTPEGQEMSQYKDSAEGVARDAADAAGAARKTKDAKAATEDSYDQAIANAWDEAINGGKPDIDAVINAAKGPDKNAPQTKKLFDLNPGEKVVDNNGNVVTYAGAKPDPAKTGNQLISIIKSDGTTAKASVPSNYNFTLAPKDATPADKADTKNDTPITNVQINELDKFFDKVANDPNIDPALKQDFDDITARLDNAEDVTSNDAKYVLDQLKGHFGGKVSPKKAPTIKTPKRAPAAVPPVTKKTASEIALAKKRMDDGKDIALNTNGLSEEQLRALKLDTPLLDENGKPLRDPNNPKKIIQDPNGTVNALLEQFPDAKVSGDNDKIILERRDWTDEVSGKTYQFELGVSRTFGDQFVQQYKFTDKETGEVKEYQLRDYKDSFAGIFSKSNGILKMRGQLLGETRPGKKFTREIGNYFGPNKDLNQRLKYFRKGTDKYGWAFLTPEENIQKFLEGTDVKYNKSMAQTGTSPEGEARFQFGNVLRGQVTPFWDALESKDLAAMKYRIGQLLGRLPDSPESRKLLTDIVRKETVKRLKGRPDAKEFHTYATALDNHLKSKGLDIRDLHRQPHVYGDGNTIAKIGDKVIYFPNEKDQSVGTLVGINPSSGKNGGYRDTVRVKFADGRVVDLLQTRNMFLADPDGEFGDPPLSNYVANVKLDEKLDLRAQKLGQALVEFRKRQAAKYGESSGIAAPDDPDVANPDPTQPYLGSDGKPANSKGAPVAGSDTPDPVVTDATPDAADATPEADATPADATPAAPKLGNVNDLQPNDSFYGQDGEFLGVVVETQEVPAADGGEPGLAIIYIDENGDEQVEVVTKDEDRNPK